MMDVDLRHLPAAFCNIPVGGMNLRPGAQYRIFFSISQTAPADVAVRDDLTVDCGPDWDAVTLGDKIIGFNRRWKDPLDGPDAELILEAHELAEGNCGL